MAMLNNQMVLVQWYMHILSYTIHVDFLLLSTYFRNIQRGFWYVNEKPGGFGRSSHIFGYPMKSSFGYPMKSSLSHPSTLWHHHSNPSKHNKKNEKKPLNRFNIKSLWINMKFHSITITSHVNPPSNHPLKIHHPRMPLPSRAGAPWGAGSSPRAEPERRNGKPVGISMDFMGI